MKSLEPDDSFEGRSTSAMDRFLAFLGQRRGKGGDEVEFTRLKDDENGFGGSDEKGSHGVGWTPEEDAGLFSRLFFTYVTPLIKRGRGKALDMEDLWGVLERDDVAMLAEAYRAEKDALVEERGRAMLWRVLWRLHKGRLLASAGLKISHDVFELSGPFILKALLESLAEGAPLWQTMSIATAMGASSAIQTLLINAYFHILFRISIHVKAQIISAIYRKALTVSSASLAETGSGKVNNLQSNDASKLWSLPQYMHQVWNAPLKIVVIVLLLSRILHIVPSLIGLSVTVAMIPLGTVTGKHLAKLRKELMRRTDARVKSITEFVTGIKAIKLYAWEEPYIDKVTSLRNEELAMVQRIALFNIINSIMFFMTPVLVALAAFWAYALMGFQLTADVAFPALSLFNVLRFPVMMLPMQLNNLINGKVSLNRIQDFLDREEREALPAAPSKPNSEGADGTQPPSVAAHNADFSWSPAGAVTLKNVSLELARGELVMVVGQVGSGKSSLLSAILGEMVCKNGGVTVRGSVAYTSQEPWIQNATLRDNILMGRDFDEARYDTVLDECALRPDLEILPGGDMAEIGEKGINLSGGQKHRAALARAVYADADIYLLDDPLSAVDSHVSRQLFEKCISGSLEGRTRVLVTHQVQFASAADRIIVIKDGCVDQVGTYEELVSRGIDLHRFIPKASEVDEEEESGGPALKKDAAAEKVLGKVANGSANGLKRSSSSGQLVKTEERSRGKVKRTVYVKYISSCGPLFLLPVAYVISTFSERGFQIAQNFVLAHWSSEPIYSMRTSKTYLNVYTLFAGVSMLFLVFRALMMAYGSVSASRHLHAHLLHKVASLPMSFFDAQPSGRLINRFAKDTASLDSMIGQSFNSFMVCLVSTTGAFFVVCFVTPAVIVLLVPIVYVYVRIQLFYIGASRELKRLDSLSMSPIFSNFVETLNGLSVIRAFSFESKFDEKNLALVSNANRAYWPLVSSNRWLSVRLEYVGASITYVCALASALFVSHSAGMSGLAITSAMNVTGLMTWMVRQVTELEVNMNSVERLTEYDHIPSEGGASGKQVTLPHDWPHAGEITVEKLYVQYRPHLPNVLKGISFHVPGRHKVGICGRTGCGKSTLMMTLYRIVEPKSGSITIDGVNTQAITLKQLRSKLSLVPQDPVIFSGTVRSNLDPFNDAGSDKEIWDAVDLSGMRGIVDALPDGKGLDSSISEGGTNLSVGQRQLLCMARALIRKSRVLILDEATSNVDNETDQLIQKTIRSAFSDCTVLTIAHRLHTIVDSDKILVLDGGQIAEYDSPSSLLASKEGLFYSLMQHASDNNYKRSGSSGALSLQDE